MIIEMFGISLLRFESSLAMEEKTERTSRSAHAAYLLMSLLGVWL
jgi:hypothetical protein